MISELLFYTDEIDDRWMADQEDAVSTRAKFSRCPECGRLDGMQRCLPNRAEASEIMRAHPRIRYYIQTSDPERVLIPCIYCNSLGIIPDGYAALAMEAV